MAFDSARNQTLLIGGRLAAAPTTLSLGRPLHETWILDGERWTGLASTGPSAAQGSACFDSSRSVVLHFGGWSRVDDVNLQNETVLSDSLWQWDGNAWTLTPSLGAWPAARSDAGFAFDSTRGKAVLFGGVGASGVSLNDLWEWNGTSWTQMLAAGTWPTGLAGRVSLAFDINSQRIIAASSASGETAGTWTWDGMQWLQLTTNAPIPGVSINLVYVPARSRVLAISNTTSASLAQRELLDNAWVALANQSNVVKSASAGIDPTTGNALAFGLLASNAAPYRAAFRFQSTSAGGRWEPLPSATGPGPSVYAAMTAVPPLQGVVLAGGVDAFNTPVTASWLLRGETWSLHEAAGATGAPAIRAGLAWDPVNAQLLFASGSRPYVWSPSTSEWRVVSTGLSPSGTSKPLVFDAHRQQVVGFNTSLQPLDWDGLSFQLRPGSVVSFTGTQYIAGTFDSSQGVVVGGGFNGVTQHLQNGAWQVVGQPFDVGSAGAPLAYSPELDGIVTYSGFNTLLPSGVLAGSAEITKLLPSQTTAWRTLSLKGPSARKRSAFAHDPTAQRVVMHGGDSFGNPVSTLGETWILSSGPAAIALQPTPFTAQVGASVELFTIARGGGPMRYVWRRNGEVLTPRAGVHGTNTDSLRITSLSLADAGSYTVTVSNACGTETSAAALLTVLTCDPIDFNNDALFPSDTDLVDFLSVLAGGPCSTEPPQGNGCNDIDFNNDGLFPADDDVVAFLRVLAGDGC